MGDRPRFSVWQDWVGKVQPNLRILLHFQQYTLPRILLLAAILFSLQLLPATPAAQAASGCVTSGPANNAYTITLCFSAPSGSGNLTGNVTVTESVTTTGTSPGIQRMIFYINGGYLIYDFQSPHTPLRFPQPNGSMGTIPLGLQRSCEMGLSAALLPSASAFKTASQKRQ